MSLVLLFAPRSPLAVNTKEKKKTDKQPPQAATVVADTSHFKCKESFA